MVSEGWIKVWWMKTIKIKINVWQMKTKDKDQVQCLVDEDKIKIKVWWMKTKGPQQAGHLHQIGCKQFPMTAVKI